VVLLDFCPAVLKPVIDLVHWNVEGLCEALLRARAGLVLGLKVGLEDVVLFFGQARLHIGTAIVMLRGRSRRGFRRAAGLLLRLRLRPRRGALAVAGEGWHVGAKAVHAGCWARRERAVAVVGCPGRGVRSSSEREMEGERARADELLGARSRDAGKASARSTGTETRAAGAAAAAAELITSDS
jgi:hypothetical protein